MVLSKDLKLAICFGLIMGAIFSICNMCFAAENVGFDVVTGIGINPVSATITPSAADSIGYFFIEPGYTYTITRNDGGFKCGFSNDVPVINLQLEDFKTGLRTFTFTYSDYQYFYFNFGTVGSNSYTITREPLQGMTGFIDNLAYDLSYANLSGVLFFVVPLMAISVLFGLGFVLLSRFMKKMRNAKGGM